MAERTLQRIKCLHGENRTRFYEALLFMLSSEIELNHPTNGACADKPSISAKKRVSLLTKFRGRVLVHYLFGANDTISNRVHVSGTKSDIKFFGRLHQEMAEHRAARQRVWGMIGMALDREGWRCN